MVERRPRFRRACPVVGCDWVQVTAWWISPEDSEEVPPIFLRIEAEQHVVNAHAPLPRTLIV